MHLMNTRFPARSIWRVQMLQHVLVRQPLKVQNEFRAYRLFAAVPRPTGRVQEVNGVCAAHQEVVEPWIVITDADAPACLQQGASNVKACCRPSRTPGMLPSVFLPPASTQDRKTDGTAT